MSDLDVRFEIEAKRAYRAPWIFYEHVRFDPILLTRRLQKLEIDHPTWFFRVVRVVRTPVDVPGPPPLK